MTIVVGYTPTPHGRAALATAAAEAIKSGRAARGGQHLPRGCPQRPQLRSAGRPGLGAYDAGGGRCHVLDPAGGQRSRGRRELIEACGEVGAELCVIGIRRRAAVSKMLLGSNADRILMEAPCPVLTVRPDS